MSIIFLLSLGTVAVGERVETVTCSTVTMDFFGVLVQLPANTDLVSLTSGFRSVFLSCSEETRPDAGFVPLFISIALTLITLLV